MIRKPWGSEVVLFEAGPARVKLLRVKPGKSLSEQYHRSKREAMMLISRPCSRSIPVSSTTSSRRHPPHQTREVHRIHGVEGEAVILEMAHGSDQDIVRLADDFRKIHNHNNQQREETSNETFEGRREYQKNGEEKVAFKAIGRSSRKERKGIRETLSHARDPDSRLRGTEKGPGPGRRDPAGRGAVNDRVSQEVIHGPIPCAGSEGEMRALRDRARDRDLPAEPGAALPGLLQGSAPSFINQQQPTNIERDRRWHSHQHRPGPQRP